MANGSAKPKNSCSRSGRLRSPRSSNCSRCDSSFRGASTRTRNLEIPQCAIAHLRSGPSDHPGMTMAVEDKAIRFRGHFMVPLLAATPLDCFITEPKYPGRTSVVHKGRVAFGAMDEVVFGYPAAEAVLAQMDRLGAARAFLMVSGSL